MTAEAVALRNEPENEMNALVQAARDALTDSMVERLTTTGANALDVLDRLNDEETRDAIHTVIDNLTEMNRVGSLQTLFDTVALLHALRTASTDNIVDRLFTFVEHLMNNMASEDFATLCNNAQTAMEEAADEAAKKTHSGGFFATLSMLNQPEAQRSLHFLLNFGAKLQQCSATQSPSE